MAEQHWVWIWTFLLPVWHLWVSAGLAFLFTWLVWPWGLCGLRPVSITLHSLDLFVKKLEWDLGKQRPKGQMFKFSEMLKTGVCYFLSCKDIQSDLVAHVCNPRTYEELAMEGSCVKPQLHSKSKQNQTNKTVKTIKSISRSCWWLCSLIRCTVKPWPLPLQPLWALRTNSPCARYEATRDMGVPRLWLARSW